MLKGIKQIILKYLTTNQKILVKKVLNIIVFQLLKCTRMGKLFNLPFINRILGGTDPLKLLHSVKPRNVEALKAEYKEKGLDSEPDNFVLYRIIGNDLYPRHKKGQARENLQFILENEPAFANCEKRWVVNRIIDKEEEDAIINLLKQYRQEYIHIPFVPEEYKKIGFDTDCLPEPGFLARDSFEELDPEEKYRAIAATYRLKNNYVMNNNGARNTALRDGKTRAKWVLPWDGNCFITQSAWEQIRFDVTSSPYLKYFAVPMTRVLDNNQLLSDDFTPDPVEEPQLIFRRDSTEEFDEEFCYGRRPKVELFWRLGIPGKWDRWADDPWDLERPSLSSEARQFGVAGWVARLFSGMKALEQDDRQRRIARVESIITALRNVDAEVSGASAGRLTSYRDDVLEEERKRYLSGEDAALNELVDKLITDAKEVLTREPYSIPDQTRVFDDSITLALAWKFTGENKYAEYGARILDLLTREWYNNNLDDSTRIIKMKDMYYYLDAVRILTSAGAVSEGTLNNFKDWLSHYLEWLLESPQGNEERRAPNNHGTYYDLQVAAIAAFLDERAILYETLVRAQSRIPRQFAPDGSQPEELTTKNTAYYCCFNFQGWIDLAEIANRWGVDLWSYASSNGTSLLKGAQWLLSCASKKWRYRQVDKFDPERFIPIWFGIPGNCNVEVPGNANLPGSRYKVKPGFYPHDGVKPYWNLGGQREKIKTVNSRLNVSPLKKPKLILHAGLHKTGTTAIQKFTAQNRSFLRKQGLFYPDYKPVYNIANDDQLEFAHAVASKAKYLSLKDAKILAGHWAQEVKTSGETIFLSAEAISRHVDTSIKGDWLIRRRGYMQKLYNVLFPFDVTVVIVLRRQDDFTRSLFQEHVMKGTNMGKFSFKEFRSRILKGKLRFLENLDLFKEYFPKVKVLIYEDLRADNMLYKNFFSTIGIDTAGMSDAGVVRQSLNAGETLLKQFLMTNNEFNEVENEKMLEWIRSTPVQAMLNSYFSGKKVDLWEDFETRKDFLSLFDEENEKICSQYLPHKARLFPPLDQSEACEMAVLPEALVAELYASGLLNELTASNKRVKGLINVPFRQMGAGRD